MESDAIERDSQMTRKIAALAASACALVSAQTLSQNIVTGRQPMAIAVNETTNKAYIVNRNSSSVTMVDCNKRTVDATIKTGSGPEAIAVNSR